MKIKLKQFKWDDAGKEKRRNRSGKETVVLERDDNYYSDGPCKECTQEFFERIYADSGPFWKLYEGAGFAIKPHDEKYLSFIAGGMYFNKNIEEKYINGSGVETYYGIKNGYLVKKTNLGIRNLIFALSSPFDEIRKYTGLIKFSFMANEMMQGYERLYRKAMEFYSFYSDEANIYDPVRTASESLERALEIMEYSIAAFICNKYKIRLRESKYVSNCELEKLSVYIETKNTDAINEEFGFYSLNPYDISYPRISEGEYDVGKYGGFRVPADNALRMRENVKFIVARYMSIMRKCYIHIGRKIGLDELVFFLRISEISKADLQNKGETEKIRELAMRRKEKYELERNLSMPKTIVVKNDKYYVPVELSLRRETNRRFKGRSISINKIVEGPAVNINNIEDYGKCVEGSVIFSKNLSPNLVMLFQKAAAVVSENGGGLCHAAIIAREMSLPCLIETRIEEGINDGEIVRLDGAKGEIFVISDTEKYEKRTTHSGRVKEVVAADKPELKVLAEDALVLNKDARKNFYVLSEGKLNEQEVGNKALNLSLLFKTFSVPDGFVIDSDYFKKLMSFEKIKLIVKDITNSDKTDLAKLSECYEKLQNEIRNIQFSRKFKEELHDKYAKLSATLVAARSSSFCEDGPKNSFAGQFDSYLNINDEENLEYAIKNCWASYYSPRSVIYRKEHKITNESAGMAVLIQKMVEPKYSGIAFSKDVMNNNSISIEVIPGTCEKLASGEVSPNVYVVDRSTLTISKVNANYDFDDNLIINVASEVLKIEKFFNSPQDVEWCMDENNKIWIIQSRPITSTCNVI